MKPTYETFLNWFEHADRYPIDETSFFFEDEDDPVWTERFLGYLPQYENPYWAGYCDSPEGAEFSTARELLDAPIWDGRSFRDRWDQVVLRAIGGIDVEEWMNMHGNT